MKHLRLATALLALATATGVGSAADITGKITLKGVPPKEVTAPLDPVCGKARGENQISSRHYVVAADGGLADVFVQIKEGLGGQKFEPPAKPIVIDQVGCEYVPYISAAQAGQKIIVRNSDPVMHNVHPMPKVAGNREYNVGQPIKGMESTFQWDKPETLLRFQCDLHRWMLAYVCVVDHPCFAISGKDGIFAIKNVPPGEYTIEILHRKTHADGKGLTRKVKVTADGAKVDFEIELK